MKAEVGSLWEGQLFVIHRKDVNTGEGKTILM